MTEMCSVTRIFESPEVTWNNFSFSNYYQMLTREKIAIFKRHNGYYDGYYVSNKSGNNLVGAEEWSLLAALIQDIFLIRTGVTAQSFENAVMEKLRVNCDTPDTASLIFELEKYLHPKA